MKNTCKHFATGFTVAIGFFVGSVTSVHAQSRVPNFTLGQAFSDANPQNIAYWLGGDSARGTYVGPNYSFWGFGDTFLANPGSTGGRSTSNLVGNTIAIGQIDANGNFSPTYFYRGTLQNKQAFFPDPAPNFRYWCHPSVMLNGNLYVFLQLRYRVPGSDPNGTYAGEFIARIKNPTAIPNQWNIEYIYMISDPNNNSDIKPGVEILPSADGKFLVVYGFYNNPRPGAPNPNKTIVLMLDTQGLEKTTAGSFINQSYIQHLSADQNNQNLRWLPGFVDRDAAGDPQYFDLHIDSVSGFTIRWNAGLQQYQVVGINGIYAQKPTPAQPQAPSSAHIFLNKNWWGPFKGPGVSNADIYNFPELNNGSDKICYTVCEWQDSGFAGLNDHNILFTYTYSSMSIPNQIADPSLYQNHAAIVDNPFYPSPRSSKASRVAVQGANTHQSSSPPDLFSDPNFPKPLPFPVDVKNPLPETLPWLNVSED